MLKITTKRPWSIWRLTECLEASPLPDAPDRDAINLLCEEVVSEALGVAA